MIDRSRCQRFTWTLARLTSPEDANRKPDLGTLAHLRRGLGKDFGQHSPRDGWVLHTLDGLSEGEPKIESWSDRDLEWACVVASLFADHRGTSRDQFGVAYRKLWHIRSEATSVVRRFTTLIDADEQDLGTHLRHAVRLLKANDISLDWGALLYDLVRWHDPDRRVQRRWCRDFWLDALPNRTPTPNTKR